MKIPASLQLHGTQLNDVLLWQDLGGVVQLCLQGQTVGVAVLMQEMVQLSEHSKWSLITEIT